MNSIGQADTSLAEELNNFFARFEVNRLAVDLPPPPATSHALTGTGSERCAEDS